MKQTWQARLRANLLPVFNRLAPGARDRARQAFKVIQSPVFSSKARWVRDEYGAFGDKERRTLMLAIARFANINRPIEGYYLEFGCHGANTMRMAYDCFRYLFDWHFVAFDSFEGLPEITEIDKQAIWEKGKLKMDEREFVQACVKHGIPRNSLTTIKGFYDVSLTDQLQQKMSFKKAAVIYIDCDLYTSTVPVLRFIRAFLQPGTIIVFDDWNCFLADPNRGERRAWREFCVANPELHFEPFVQTSMQKAFVYTGASGPQPA